MIAMQFTGLGLFFLTLPLFLIPLVEESIPTAPPPPTSLRDHVVVCEFTPRGDTLVGELESMDTRYVVVESDRERARELDVDGYSVIHGNPESVEDLVDANAGEAVALVADAADEINASIILSAKQVDPEIHVISLIEDADLADYHRYAGADRVVSPRRLLGDSLAGKSATSISTDLGDAVEIAGDFEVVELLVQRGAEVEGKTIADSGIGQEPGVNIIGAWFRGEFVSPPPPDEVIDEHTILLVTGRETQVERLKELTLSEVRRYRRGTVVVGHGEVGSTAADALIAAEVPTVVVDREEKPGVDVVGDITDRQTIEKAGVTDARSVILAVDNDTTAVFATLVINRVAPGIEIIARANEAESIPKLYRAGADVRPRARDRFGADARLEPPRGGGHRTRGPARDRQDTCARARRDESRRGRRPRPDELHGHRRRAQRRTHHGGRSRLRRPDRRHPRRRRSRPRCQPVQRTRRVSGSGLTDGTRFVTRRVVPYSAGRATVGISAYGRWPRDRI
jgi:Trk K+ transport system NAD-binding subunit